MTCKTNFNGRGVLAGPAFPPYTTRVVALIPAGSTSVSVDFEAERDTVIEKMVSEISTALLVATNFAKVSVTYCNTKLLEGVDLATFDIAAFKRAQFRAGVAENKKLRFTVELDAAEIADRTWYLNLSGIQGAGCCRGPSGEPLMNPPPCGLMNGGGGDLEGPADPPYSVSFVLDTNAAGDASVEFQAERGTLVTDLITTGGTGAVLPIGASLEAEYCNTKLIDGASVDLYNAFSPNGGVFVCGVAENKKLRISIAGGGAATRHIVTLTGVQGPNCCRGGG